MHILESLKQKKDFLHLTEASDGEIFNAQTQLGLQFSSDYIDYVKQCGVATFEGHELTGICKSPRLNVVSVTERFRQTLPNISHEWYVIEELNFDNKSIWQDKSGLIYAVDGDKAISKIADSLADYIDS